MFNLSEYQIKVEGRLSEDSFNAASPIRITVKESSDSETSFTIYADQAGLVGLIRFLHQQGFLILSAHMQR